MLKNTEQKRVSLSVLETGLNVYLFWFHDDLVDWFSMKNHFEGQSIMIFR